MIIHILICNFKYVKHLIEQGQSKNLSQEPIPISVVKHEKFSVCSTLAVVVAS